LTDHAPEDFETITQRHVAVSPFAIRGPAGVLREMAGLVVALLARTPDLGKLETRLGVARISNSPSPPDSLAWQITQA
jgi:hypothetical protein